MIYKNNVGKIKRIGQNWVLQLNSQYDDIYDWMFYKV